jgi:hypothetical protein
MAKKRSTPNFGLSNAVDCARSLLTPNLTTFELARCVQLCGCQPNPPHFGCASTPNSMTDTSIKRNSCQPNASSQCSRCAVVEAFSEPHSCQPNPTPECARCMSTPNSKICGLASFMKHGCRSHMSTSAPSCRCQMDRADILAELNALQERCSTLEFALAESSLMTPHHKDGSALLSPRPISDGAAMSVNPDDCGFSSGTGPIVTGPEIWGVSFAGDLNANFMDQTSQNPLGHALQTTSVLGSEPSILNQETPAEDHHQLDAFLDNIDTELSEIFDFNAASLPLGFDIHEMTTSVAESATEDELDIPPTLPSISQPESDLTVVPPAVSRTEIRHSCQSCMETFGRSSDRDRHALSHNPNAPRYACSFQGCNRVGGRGFLRRDKLIQHQAHMRH